MALVVFLRGVNVGGQKAFRPSVLAREMAGLDVVSVGAAGTFVVRKAVSQATLRQEFVRRLPFSAELMICPARAVLALAADQPFRDQANDEEVTPYVSVLAKRPPALPLFPLCQPDGAAWQVKLFEVSGRFALSLHRRLGRTLLYPNQVVEKRLGVPATTRNWSTISALCEVLRRY